MIERVVDYPGYLIRFRGEKLSRRAWLLLHGFPAHRGVKNLDVADALFRKTGDTVYILHYKGLGESRGTFRFTDSIRETRGVVDRIVGELGHEKIVVIGHSWGGLVALNLLLDRSPQIERTILLSPVCHMTKTEDLYKWLIDEAPNEWPGVYGELSRAEITADFDVILEKHLPSVIVPTLSTEVPISLIQAKLDAVTTADRAAALTTKFRKPIRYRELNLDHSFTENRRELIETIFQESNL